MSKTNHEDLINMGGYWSYEIQRDPDKWQNRPIIIGENKYEIIDYKADEVSGLNAVVLKNINSGEITIIYVGTQPTVVPGTPNKVDIYTDAMLVSDITPAQYQAALDYYNWAISQGYDVSYLAGNSLAGGLADYVAFYNPDVTAVTINPAPVPNELSGAQVNNVYNYIIGNDPLHLATVAAGMDARVIGKKIMLKAGLYANRLVNNHVGMYEISNGKTKYSTASFVPFSIWHENAILSSGNYGSKINIDVANMELLIAALQKQKTSLDEIIRDNFDASKTELEEYKKNKIQRESDARDKVSEEILSTISKIKSEAESSSKLSVRSKESVESLLTSSEGIVHGFFK